MAISMRRASKRTSLRRADALLSAVMTLIYKFIYHEGSTLHAIQDR